MNKNWKQGTIVQDSGGNIQIVLFVDNDETFKCMNLNGTSKTFSSRNKAAIVHQLKSIIQCDE